MLRLYPHPTADSLRRTAADVYGIPRECILAGNGSDDLLTIIFRSILDPGDTVAAFNPTYTLYETLAELQDASVSYIETGPDFRIPDDPDLSGSRFTVIANPNSPTGVFTSPQRIRKMADMSEGILVVDEAYGDFAPDTCLRLVPGCPNIIVLRSFSKSYSLAGARLGLAFAAPGIISQLTKVKDSYNVNRFTLAAGAAALNDREWMESNREQILKTRNDLVSGLARLGFSTVPSEANFVFTAHPRIRASRLCTALKERNILVRFFDRPRTRDYLRITVGTDSQTRQLVDTLETIIPDLGKET
jgi:histidinol-phosphate aminotransferase